MIRKFLSPILLLLLAAPAVLAAADSQPDVLAKVGGKDITKAEVLEAAAPQLAELRQKEYEILKSSLDQVIDRMLLERAAKEKGVDIEAYLKSEVEDKAPAPSDDDVNAFYEKYKSRLNGQTLDQVRPRIVKQLRLQKNQELFNKLVAGLRAQAGVKVLLDPPRIDVDDGGNPSWGPKDAKVTIIEFSDYQCPYCGRVEGTVAQIKERYGDKVRFVFRDFPLSFHQNAQKASEAAGCAAEQGKFWEMHDKLFANQQELGADKLAGYATDLGLDMEAFNGCLDSGKRAAEIEADLKAGSAAGVTGTPAFFINGRFLNGAQPFSTFEQIIEEELAR